MDRKITPHIPVWDKSARSDGTFSRADFVFDRSATSTSARVAAAAQHRNIIRATFTIVPARTTAIAAH